MPAAAKLLGIWGDGDIAHVMEAATLCHRIAGVLPQCPTPQPSRGSQFRHTSARGPCGPCRIRLSRPSCFRWSCGSGLVSRSQPRSSRSPHMLFSPRPASSARCTAPTVARPLQDDGGDLAALTQASAPSVTCPPHLPTAFRAS